jgi:hypothetical protein
MTSPGNTASGTAPAHIDPHLAMLARVSGRTLLIIFLVVVTSSAVPFYPRSFEWGNQFSNRIVETTSFAFVGVAFLRFASVLVPSPDPIEEPRQAMQLARQRDGAIRLCRLGIISLLLLSFWQVVLLLQGVSRIDQQRTSLSKQLGQRISQTEQSIRQAPAGVVEQEWQRFQAAQPQGVAPQGISGTEQQRQALIKTLEAEQKQIGLNVSKQVGETLFGVVITTLRRLALCMAFILGFQAMSRRLY